jgi:hypothetical protein
LGLCTSDGNSQIVNRAKNRLQRVRSLHDEYFALGHRSADKARALAVLKRVHWRLRGVPRLDFGHVLEEEIKIKQIRVVEIVFGNLTRVTSRQHAALLFSKNKTLVKFKTNGASARKRFRRRKNESDNYGKFVNRLAFSRCM